MIPSLQVERRDLELFCWGSGGGRVEGEGGEGGFPGRVGRTRFGVERSCEGAGLARRKRREGDGDVPGELVGTSSFGHAILTHPFVVSVASSVTRPYRCHEKRFWARSQVTAERLTRVAVYVLPWTCTRRRKLAMWYARGA